MKKGKQKLTYKYVFKRGTFNKLKEIFSDKEIVTKRELARHLSVGETNLNAMFGRKRQPTLEMFMKLKEYGVDEKTIFSMIEPKLNK